MSEILDHIYFNRKSFKGEKILDALRKVVPRIGLWYQEICPYGYFVEVRIKAPGIHRGIVESFPMIGPNHEYSELSLSRPLFRSGLNQKDYKRLIPALYQELGIQESMQ
jgi:hypothetical protein